MTEGVLRLSFETVGMDSRTLWVLQPQPLDTMVCALCCKPVESITIFPTAIHEQECKQDLVTRFSSLKAALGFVPDVYDDRKVCLRYPVPICFTDTAAGQRSEQGQRPDLTCRCIGETLLFTSE